MNTTTIHRISRTLILLLFISTSLLSCARFRPQNQELNTLVDTLSQEMYWPTQDWRTSTPEEQGMDSSKITQMLSYIDQQHLDFDSLLIIRHGYIVSETYYNIYHQDSTHELYSVTKSFISTLIGIAIDQGLIDGVSHRVADYFPEAIPEDGDPLKSKMTLENLLTMTTGLEWEDGDPVFREMYSSGDWVAYVLNKPVVEKPGSHFNYCSGCSHVLSAIIKKTTGMNTQDFARKTLFGPLGITKFKWDADSDGTSIGGWGLQITPREMAKLGYLYLHQGEWDGQQIVSSDWVRKATQKQIEAVDNLNYGYQWWIYPRFGAYVALGLYGQTIFVVPQSDLLVVTTAGSFDNHDEIFRLIEDYIIPALQ